MKNIILHLVGLLFVALMLFSCNQNLPGLDGKNASVKRPKLTHASNLRKVSFQPYWVANAQFVGYYMAVEYGIYEKYGLDVEIIPFRPSDNKADLMKNRKVDFTPLWLMNGIGMKASGVDIVNIAQFSSRSSLMLVTKKSSGINNLEDMNHHKAGIWIGFELQPTALFRKYNLDVEMIPIGSTNNLFLSGAVDIINANWFDEYHSIVNSGFDANDLNTFFFADYGLNFLEDGIYCLSDKLHNDPLVCAKFVAGTAEGWALAFSHPDLAVDLVIEYAKKSNLPVNRSHQRWMIDRYKDLYYQNGKFTTKLSEEDFKFAIKLLKESGQISNPPAFNEFYQHFDSTLVPPLNAPK